MHAAAPFANVPTGHVAAVNAHEVAPWVLKAPKTQGRHVAEDDAPKAALYVPAMQGMHAAGIAAPKRVLYDPALQEEQVEMEAAPVAFDHVPGGQGDWENDCARQYEPGGQVDARPPLQYLPATGDRKQVAESDEKSGDAHEQAGQGEQ